jgi:hypothetical protein
MKEENEAIEPEKPLKASQDEQIQAIDERHIAAARAGLIFEKNLLPPQASGLGISNLADFQRLERHLSTLREKVALCRDIMRASANKEYNETLAEVVGFLEACHRRLPDIIEAGTMGMLSVDLLAEVMEVTDLTSETIKLFKNGNYGNERDTREDSSTTITVVPTVFSSESVIPASSEDDLL